MEELLKDKHFLTKEYFIKPEKKKVKSKIKTENGIDYEDQEENTDDMEETESITESEDKFDEKGNEDDNKDENAGNKDKEEKGKVVALEAFDKKIIGLYFSAGWCPPCREFTPLLRDLYEETSRKKMPLEILFISFDKTLEDMESYYLGSHGDWLAVPFDDPLKEELKTKYEIKAVPKLIIIREDGDILTTKGRKEVQDKGILSFRGWQELSNFRANRPRSQAAAATDTEKKEENC